MKIFEAHWGHALMALAIVVFMSSTALGLGHADVSEALRTIFGAAGGIVLTFALASFKR